MSHKSKQEAETPAVVHAHEHEHDHDGDLIDVPQGKSRLRYIATIGLVLFLLVIFVVADLFQSSMTGGGARPDAVYISWEDPVDGTPNEVTTSDFFETARMLKMMTQLGAYYPDSLRYSEPDPTQTRRPEASEEDVASFFIFEDLAMDNHIAVSQKEHVDLLRALFRDSAGLRFAADRTRMSIQALEDAVRRVSRVNKMRDLLLGTLAIPDADKIVIDWQAQHPEYKFQVISVGRDDFVATAEGEVIDDEALLTWFRERPQFEQEKLYTETRVVPEVAYVPLTADANFDPAKLLAAYPAPEGVDTDEQARSYHRQFRTFRFRVPEPEEEEQTQEDPTDDGETDPTDDGGTDATDEGETDPADDGGTDATDGAEADAIDDDVKEDQTPAVKKLFYEFDEVEDQVRAEAPIHAAFVQFKTDIQDRVDAGEEIDLVAEAERLGLVHTMGAEEGYERDGIAEVDGWGSASIAGQLVFSIEGTFLPRVVVTENAMTIARVVTKKEREEPPFAEIRDDVVTDWSLGRATELAVDALENVRGVLAARPDDVELADWNPEVDLAALKTLAAEAGYTVYERPWLERFSVPDDDFAAASPADQYIRMAANLFELEPGQVAPPGKSRDGQTAFLVRFEGEQEKDVSALKATTLLQARGQAREEARRAFGATVFLGDGPWLTSRTKLAFPERDRRDTDRAAEEALNGAPAGAEPVDGEPVDGEPVDGDE